MKWWIDGHITTVSPQELFKKVRSILNKLTPQKFNQLMKQVTDLTIDTEERLKGVIDLVFEKAIDEPSFSVAYGNMCRCLATVSCSGSGERSKWKNKWTRSTWSDLSFSASSAGHWCHCSTFLKVKFVSLVLKRLFLHFNCPRTAQSAHDRQTPNS